MGGGRNFLSVAPIIFELCAVAPDGLTQNTFQKYEKIPEALKHRRLIDDLLILDQLPS